MVQVSLNEAKTQLTSLVDRAAGGEELVTVKNGIPMPKLAPLDPSKQPRQPFNALGVTFIASDFDATDLETLASFNAGP